MATYIRLTDLNTSAEKEKQFHQNSNSHVIVDQEVFSKIPGSPIAYWASDKVVKAFEKGIPLSEIASPRQGLATADNNRFLRFWHEVPYRNIGFGMTRLQAAESGLRWFPHNKGGSFRRWYGNEEYVVNWKNDGEELRAFERSVLRNQDYYFKEAITWSRISQNTLSFRYSPKGHIFDCAGSKIFTEKILFFLALMNSIVPNYLMLFINTTLAMQTGYISMIPIINCIDGTEINSITNKNISISKQEWNSRETSWDFTTNELLKHKNSPLIRDAVAAYCEHWAAQFHTLHENEEELNRIFLKIYDLEDELSPEVALEDVTILREEAPERRDGLHFREDVLVKQFLSYAVGCFFGRYSPHTDGLVLANAGDGVEAYKEEVGRVPAYLVRDNVLPLTDEPYFAQDVLALLKAFLADTFGEGSVSENIDYLAGVLSPRSRASSESVIRDYFIKDFYRDHKRMYQNRPIYWLCTTGKDGAFAALFYLHRYEPALLARVRHDYVLRLQERHQALHASLEGDDLPTQRRRDDLQRRIQALQAYDVTLKDLADRYIPLDLDDGVKVNIATFEGIVEGV